MNRIALGLSAAIVLGGVAYGAYEGGRHAALTQTAAPAKSEAAQSPALSASTGVLPPAPQQAPAPAATTATPAPALAPAPTPAPTSTVARRTEPKQPETPRFLAYTGYEVETSGASPEACLRFNLPLRTDGEVKPQDKLRINPQIRPAARVVGERLCLRGLSFGETYEVTIARGLEATSGAKLEQDEVTAVSLRDAPPSVAFPGNGYVLPRLSTTGLAIETVNATKLDVRVLRIGDRLIARELRDYWRSKNLYEYAIRQIANDRGTQVWQGTLDVERQPNRKVTTVFPFATAVTDRKPGAYLVIAKLPGNNDDDDWDSDSRTMAAQWLVDTDIALTLFSGQDGMRVLARSLDTAQPIANATVTLVANNNDELGKVTTDGAGLAMLPAALTRGTGGRAPRALLATGANGDFALMDLKRAAFDLSDRGVSGREAPGVADAFLYADRGIYRPGETVHLSMQVRDTTGRAIGGQPVTVAITRPSGVEYRKQAVTPDATGTATLSVPLPQEAMRGLWVATAYYDPAGKPVGRLQFDVQDFVPERLRVIASSPAKAILPNQEVGIDIDGAFLYGAPAAGLAVEVSAKIAADPAPFAALSGYKFGLFDDEFTEATLDFDGPETDATGKTRATATLTDPPGTTRPLKADISVAMVQPGGRTTRTALSLPVKLRDRFVGVKPVFANRVTPGEAANFELRVVTGDGTPIAAGGLRWTLIREVYDYTWVQVDGRWRYNRTYRDRPAGNGEIDVAADRPTTLSTPALEWGRHRLIVEDRGTGTVTTLRFDSGYTWRDDDDEEGSGEVAETPDTVGVASEQPRYRPGELARIRITPPFAGRAMVAVANEKVLLTREVDVAQGGTTVDIPVTAAWGAGAYVMVDLVRPLQARKSREPVRAVGVAWVERDPSDRTLTVAMNAPEKLPPRGRLEIPVKVTGADGPAVLTLAAVDEGILQLTRFKSPEPQKHFLGKRRLGVEMRDDYGQLIEPSQDAAGKVRSGGDGLGGAGLSVVPTKTVAMFSGIVNLDTNGEGRVALDIPDFAGELRLMAVASTATKMGSAEGKIVIRDPIVADVSLPRFLAPGDQGRLTLLAHNVAGPAGAYKLKLTTEGPIAIPDAERTYELGAEARRIETIAINATGVGIAKVHLTVEGPGNIRLAHEWDIQVRSPHYPLTVETAAFQAPGEEFRVDSSLIAPFELGSVKVSVNYSPFRGIDVGGLLQSLYRYPYGCTEQQTSIAMPLLSYGDPVLLGMGGKRGDPKIDDRVQGVVSTLLERQGDDGSIGLWRPGDDAATPFVQVYAIDFLTLAKAKGRQVPDSAIQRSMRYLQALTERRSGSDEKAQSDRIAQAYAFYVLARESRVDLYDLRNFHDAALADLNDRFALASLGAALAMAGDNARATSAFQRFAQVPAITPRTTRFFDFYRSDLRQTAAGLAFAAEARRTQTVEALMRGLERYDMRPASLTTQEKTWLLRAAQTMAAGNSIELAVNDMVPATAGRSGPVTLVPDLDEIAAGYRVTNKSDREVWRTVSIHGEPKLAPPPMNAGYTLTKKLLSLKGEPIDPTKLTQNDRFIVSLQGTMSGDAARQTILVDMLPAGWEIEAMVSPVQTDDDDARKQRRSAYGFLPRLSNTRVREARDDRFVAAFDMGGLPRWYASEDDENGKEFHLAYVVRAVTPGTFVMPAAMVEDMYKPGVLGRTAAGTTTIAAKR